MALRPPQELSTKHLRQPAQTEAEAAGLPVSPDDGVVGQSGLTMAAEEERLLVAGAIDEMFYRHQCLSLPTDADAAQHYLAHGWRMGWDPSPDFSTNLYLERSPDVRAAGINPFYHYLRHGRTEGRVANAHAAEMADAIGAEFDHDFYLRNHPTRRHRQGVRRLRGTIRWRHLEPIHPVVRFCRNAWAVEGLTEQSRQPGGWVLMSFVACSPDVA